MIKNRELKEIKVLKNGNYYHIELFVRTTYCQIEDDYVYEEDPEDERFAYNSTISRVFDMTQGAFMELAYKKGATKCKFNKMLFDNEETAKAFSNYLQSFFVMNALK